MTDGIHPSRAVSKAAATCLGIALLAGCATFEAPRIVAGDATSVSLVSGWFIPESVANSFCETHGKRAVYQSSAETTPGSDRRIHYFNCEEPVRE